MSSILFQAAWQNPSQKFRVLAFRKSFGERLPGACRCQAEAIAAELTALGEMSLRIGVSDVQVSAEIVT